MTREERMFELRTTISILKSIMDRLSTEQSRLEKIRCKDVAKKVSRAWAKLQDALWAATEKGASM